MTGAAFPASTPPACSPAILDPKVGGHFRIGPVDPVIETNQEYVPDTNVLRTTFHTASGVVSLTDFMPAPADHDNNPETPLIAPNEIHRIVTCESGAITLRCDFQPRHDYARTVPSFRSLGGNAGGGAVQARGGRQALTLLADIPLVFDDRGVVHDFQISEGQTVTFVLSYGHGGPSTPEGGRTAEKLEHTQRYWRGLVTRMDYEGLWRDSVVRSFLALHLMMYHRTGAIVAAPTTSLPETLGGSRNWDYRFSWLRDTAFTVDILYRLGDAYGADHYMHWLLQQCQLGRRKTRIVYGITPSSSLREYTLDHLSGYEDSAPVRIGNAAADHLQMDVFRRGYPVHSLPTDPPWRNTG